MCFLLYETTLFHSTASVQSRVQQLVICGHIANNTDFVFLLGNVATQEKVIGYHFSENRNFLFVRLSNSLESPTSDHMLNTLVG